MDVRDRSEDNRPEFSGDMPVSTITDLTSGNYSSSLGSDVVASRRLPTLLIVDDDPFIRKLITSTLRGDCAILNATNGIEAIDVCQRERPDLVILDYVMPGLNGYEVCRRIRTDIGLAHTKVIILTAYASADGPVRAEEVGANAYLRKPFGPRQLLDIVTSLIEN